MGILIFFWFLAIAIFLFLVINLINFLYTKNIKYRELKRRYREYVNYIKANQYIFETAIKTFDEIKDDKFEEMLSDESVVFGIRTKDGKLACFNSDNLMNVKFGTYVFHIPYIKEYRNTIKKLQFHINHISLGRKFNADKETIDKAHKIKNDILKNNL
jgi:hypothetical protein